MNKQKKLLIIAGYAPSLANFRGKLIEELVVRGWSVTAVAPDFSEHPEVISFLRGLNVDYKVIPLARNGLNPFRDLQTCLAIRKLVKAIRPEVVLSYTVKPVIWSGFALIGIEKVRYYALITGLGFAFQAQGLVRKILTGVVRNLYRQSLSYASIVMFQNEDDQRVFTSNGIIPAQKSRVVNGSGVDLLQFKFAEAPVLPPIKFLMIARLLADKGLREYVASAKIVKARHPGVEFHLVGWIDTNHEAIKQEELDTWVNSGLIKFHGRLSDVRDVITRCHVYVLPSYREGTPRTVLEAMAVGRAVITTQAPGCKETVIDGYNGYLVPVRDAETLAGRMLKFIDEPQLVSTMGLASREYVEQKYCVHKVNRKMLFYMGILNEETI